MGVVARRHEQRGEPDSQHHAVPPGSQELQNEARHDTTLLCAAAPRSAPGPDQRPSPPPEARACLGELVPRACSLTRTRGAEVNLTERLSRHSWYPRCARTRRSRRGSVRPTPGAALAAWPLIPRR